MTPAICPPPEYRPPTASAAIVVPTPQYVRAEPDSEFVRSFPGGIDYDRWIGVVEPSPREDFADRLDLLDLLED